MLTVLKSDFRAKVRKDVLVLTEPKGKAPRKKLYRNNGLEGKTQ